MVFKTHQENPITALIRAVKAAWNGELVIEMAPKGDSQSNGLAESAVSQAEGMTRTIKSALEARLGVAIRDSNKIMLWVVEWAGLVL